MDQFGQDYSNVGFTMAITDPVRLVAGSWARGVGVAETQGALPQNQFSCMRRGIVRRSESPAAHPPVGDGTAAIFAPMPFPRIVRYDRPLDLAARRCSDCCADAPHVADRTTIGADAFATSSN